MKRKNNCSFCRLFTSNTVVSTVSNPPAFQSAVIPVWRTIACFLSETRSVPGEFRLGIVFVFCLFSLKFSSQMNSWCVCIEVIKTLLFTITSFLETVSFILAFHSFALESWFSKKYRAICI